MHGRYCSSAKKLTVIIRYGIYEPYVQYNDDRRRLNPYTNPASHLSLEIGVKDVLLHEKVSSTLNARFQNFIARERGSV